MIRMVKRKKRKIITSAVKALISDYGGKKWSQLQLVVYENGREYIYIYFNSIFLHNTEDFRTRETRNGTSMSPKQSRSVPSLLW